MNILVFDFGGTTVKCARWQDGDILDAKSFPTPRCWDSFAQLVVETKKDFEVSGPLDGVTFSFPGSVDVIKGEIRGITPIPYTQKRPLRQELSDMLDLPVAIANDANCAALAEVWQGVAQGVNNALFIIIGTGIGGVLLFNGKIHHGRNLFGGEFGVTLVDGQIPWSETATAVHMARRYCRRLGRIEDSVSGEEVFYLAKSGDTVAQGVVADFYKNLSTGIFNLQTSFDPDMIIIGGGISANNEVLDTLKRSLDNLLAQYNFSEIEVDLKACKFKNNANLIGAVKNFFDEQGV